MKKLIVEIMQVKGYKILTIAVICNIIFMVIVVLINVYL